MVRKRSLKTSAASLWPVAAAVMFIALIAGAVWIYFLYRAANGVDRVLNWPEKAANRLAAIFQSKVTVNGTSFTLAEKNIAELALVQRRIVCHTKYDVSFLGSDAFLIVKGVYTIKAGYNLNEPFDIRFDKSGHVVTASFPPARILSISEESRENYFVSQGVLKKLSPKDMRLAYASNLEQAKKEAMDFGLLTDTEAQLKQRLNDLLGAYGANVLLAPPAPVKK
jgi:hypothetical protein